LRANNDNIINLFKTLIKTVGSSPGSSAQIPYLGAGAKKLLKAKGLPNGYMNAHPLKPLFAAISKSLKHIENQNVF
jgi:hypothetical protein